MLVKIKKGIKDPVKALQYIVVFIKSMLISKPEEIFEVNSDFFIGTKTVAVCIGFNPWKREYFRNYLPEYTCVFVKGETPSFVTIRALKRLNKSYEVFIWSYLESESVYQYCIKNQTILHRVEDGFIRSVGLGSDRTEPLSLVIDSDSLYFNPRTESDLERIVINRSGTYTEEELKYSRQMIDKLISKKISKYNFIKKDLNIKSLINSEKESILVIGQVEDDMSIRLGYDGQITNLELLQLARNENKDAMIFFKPHPDVLKGNRENKTPIEKYEKIAKIVPSEIGLHDIIDMCSHIYTITSLSGFEALLRGKKVTCLGSPFYAQWGLTDDRCLLASRRKKYTLSIEELFYAAYIEYPIYKKGSLEDTIVEIELLLDRSQESIANEN